MLEPTVPSINVSFIQPLAARRGYSLWLRSAFLLSFALSAAQVLTAEPVCERFGPAHSRLTVVVLHGASGPEAYRSTAMRVANEGYTILFPHFYDATKGQSATDDNMKSWVSMVENCIQVSSAPESTVALFGISLGASVALAEGTVSDRIDSVVSWSGSLPDYAFLQLHRLPPLLILHGAKDTNVPVINAQQLFTLCERTHTVCTGKIYPNEGHLFINETQDAWQRTFAFFQARASKPIPVDSHP